MRGYKNLLFPTISLPHTLSSHTQSEKDHTLISANQAQSGISNNTIMPAALEQYSMKEVHTILRLLPAPDHKFVVAGIRTVIDEDIQSERMEAITDQIAEEGQTLIKAAHPEFDDSEGGKFTAFFIAHRPAPTPELPDRQYIRLTKTVPQTLIRGQTILMVFRVLLEEDAAGRTHDIAMMPEDKPTPGGSLTVYDFHDQEQAINLKKCVEDVKKNPFQGLAPSSSPPTETVEELTEEEVIALLWTLAICSTRSADSEADNDGEGVA